MTQNTTPEPKFIKNGIYRKGSTPVRDQKIGRAHV